MDTVHGQCPWTCPWTMSIDMSVENHRCSPRHVPTVRRMLHRSTFTLPWRLMASEIPTCHHDPANGTTDRGCAGGASHPASVRPRAPSACTGAPSMGHGAPRFCRTPRSSDFAHHRPEAARLRAKGTFIAAVCLSRAAEPGDLLASFDVQHWECLRDGALCFAPEGESSTDLGGAQLFAWRRRA